MPNKFITILFLGDICSTLGREAAKKCIDIYKEKKKIDFIIANGENTTHGNGLSFSHYNELISYGIDVITNGNHFMNVRDALNPDLNFENAVRPYNLDPSLPGIGTKLFVCDGIKIRVTNLLGRVFINMSLSNPFYDFEKILKETDNDEIHIVDFHGEATAEKRCFAEYFDGQVTAVIGTHTHVQTNDAKVLNKGTFFLTDVGMNGAYDSVLGVEKDGSIIKTMTGKPAAFNIPKVGNKLSNGVILKIDVKTKKVSKFELINDIYL